MNIENFEVLSDHKVWDDKKLRPIERVISGNVVIGGIPHSFKAHYSLTVDMEPPCQITPDFKFIEQERVLPPKANYGYSTIKNHLNKYLACQQINKLPSTIEFYAPSSTDNVSCVNMFIKNDDGDKVVLSWSPDSGYVIEQGNIKGFLAASDMKTEEEYMNYALSTVGLTERYTVNTLEAHRIKWTGKNLTEIKSIVERYNLDPEFTIYYSSGDPEESKEAIRKFFEFHSQN